MSRDRLKTATQTRFFTPLALCHLGALLLAVQVAAAQSASIEVRVVESDTFEGGQLLVDLLVRADDAPGSTLGSATVDLDYADEYFTFAGVVGSDMDPTADGYTYSTTALTGDPIAGDGSGSYLRLSVAGTNVGPAFGEGSGFVVPGTFVTLGRLEFTITSAGASATDIDLFVRDGSVSIGFFENAGNDPANGVIVEAATVAITNANDIGLASDESSLDFEGEYLFDQPYPNPFHSISSFDFAVRYTQDVSIEVYDAVGRRVARIHNGPVAPKQRIHFSFDGGRLGSGVYHIRARGESFTAVRSVVLVK